MRIAIVSPVFPPYKGGIGQAAYLEAVELARRGHEVAVFTPKRKTMDLAAAGFRLRRLRPFLKYGNAAFLPQLFWKLSAFGGDVVHLHYPFFGGAEIIWWWKSKIQPQTTSGSGLPSAPRGAGQNPKSKIRLVITYHHDVAGRGSLGKFFKWHTKNLMPKILAAADKIIVSSFDYAKNSNVKEIFAKYPEKFVEIPFGVDLDKFQPAGKDAKILAKHSLKFDDKIILFVGGLDRAHYFKGLDVLINSKCQIPNTKLLIVGDGNLKPRYERLARDLKIGDDVIFAGAVSSDDLPKYYNLADVVVLPSIDESEAFGIVLIEAMACAKPVIASNLPGVRSVVDDGKNSFLIEPKNIGQLAEKIKYFLEYPDSARQFGQSGREKVLQKYSMEKTGEKIEAILRG